MVAMNIDPGGIQMDSELVLGVEMETLATRGDGGLRAGSGAVRDREPVRFIGRHGAVAIEHVMGALGVGRTMAYRRVAECVDRGLVERLDLVRSEPTLLRATRAGLRYAGLGLEPARVSPGSVNHWLSCASIALRIGEEFGAERVVSARELRLNERIEGRPIASSKVGENPGGEPRLHRPDLAILGGDRVIAVEVELTPKAPDRLLALIRAWRRARWVAEVRYFCAPGLTQRAVEQAVRKARAGDRIRILEAGR